MAREIRRVPPDWLHPKYESSGTYIPLCDEDYDSACQRWYSSLKKFRRSKTCKWYHERAGMPPYILSRYRRRKWTKKEATHYQLYEIDHVGLGVPVSPVVKSKKDLVDLLMKRWVEEVSVASLELSVEPNNSIR